MEMSEKMRPTCHATVSVLDFGAVGDGMADNASSIQAALASGASHVIIPAGTFVIGNVLKPKEGQCIEINGTLKVCDSVIQPLRNDVEVGDSEVVVEDGGRYCVGQWVTLHDDQLPIHLIEWVTPRDAQRPTHGATYQTRRINAGNARIVGISKNMSPPS